MLPVRVYLPADCIEIAITFGPNAPTEHYGLAVVHRGFSLGSAVFRWKSAVNSTFASKFMHALKSGMRSRSRSLGLKMLFWNVLVSRTYGQVSVSSRT